MRKNLLFILCLLITVAMMAGCTQTPVTTSTSAPSGSSSAPAVKVTLDYWICQNALNDPKETVKELSVVKAFGTANPDITINLIPIGSNSTDYNAKLQMAASTNSLPDMTNVSFGFLDEWSAAKVITELTFLNKDADYMARFRAGAFDSANRYCAKGTYWGVPIQAEAQGWAYNTAYFKKYSLEIPKTFDELINCVKVFKKNSVLPIAHGATDIWAIWGYHAMFCRYGLTEDICKQLTAGTLKFKDCQPFVKTFGKILELAQAGAYADNVGTTSDAQAKALFLENKAAMYTFATTFINELDASKYSKDFVFNWGPDFSDGTNSKTVALKPFGWVLAVGSKVAGDPDKLAAATTFIKYIASDEATSLYFTKSGHITATKMSNTDTSSLSPLYKSVFNSMEDDAIVVPDLCQAWFDASIKVPYRTAVTGMITKTLTVEKAIGLLQDWGDLQ